MYDKLFAKLFELESLAEIFEIYFLYKSEDGISQTDFNFQIDFFVVNFSEKIGNLRSLLLELDGLQREADNEKAE